MRGSHQCSLKPLLLPTVTPIFLMTISIKLLRTSFKWHFCRLVMQILFFVCRLSIKKPNLSSPLLRPSPLLILQHFVGWPL